MPKKRKAPPERAPVDAKEDEEDEEVGESADDDDDSDDAELTLEESQDKDASLQIDFGFFDPIPSDFHGMRALLTSGGANSLLPSTYDASGLADVLSEQAAVGSVAKVVAKDSEEPADVDDVLGFLTAISLDAHKDKGFVKEFCQSVTQRCADAKAKDHLTKLLADRATGLIISTRMINLPAALVPSLFTSLLKDLQWAAENAEPVSERATYKFKQLLVVARVALPAGDAGSSSTAAGGIQDSGAAEGGKKKKKQRKAEASMALASQLESLEFERPEEEILAAASDWTAVLNGTGRSRQLLISLSQEAIHQAIPAMHAAMDDQ